MQFRNCHFLLLGPDGFPYSEDVFQENLPVKGFIPALSLLLFLSCSTKGESMYKVYLKNIECFEILKGEGYNLLGSPSKVAVISVDKEDLENLRRHTCVLEVEPPRKIQLFKSPY